MSSDPEFESLVDRHYGALHRFALSLARNDSAAADLTQQTFLVWARKGGQLRDRSKAKTWLFTTLHRLFLESVRRADRFSDEPLADLDDELPSLAPEQARQVDARTLLDALAEVDPAYRGAVSLFYLDDHSYVEIADILGVPLGTVKSRIARGLKQLQRRVGERQPVAAKPNG